MASLDFLEKLKTTQTNQAQLIADHERVLADLEKRIQALESLTDDEGWDAYQAGYNAGLADAATWKDNVWAVNNG